MLTFDSLPQARLVRKGGREFAPPPAPRTPHHPGDDGALREHLRGMLSVALGLWPLTGVVLLAFGLLVMAGLSASP